jgi:hypothetical protein
MLKHDSATLPSFGHYPVAEAFHSPYALLAPVSVDFSPVQTHPDGAFHELDGSCGLQAVNANHLTRSSVVGEDQVPLDCREEP